MKRVIHPTIAILIVSLLLTASCNSWLDNEFHPLPSNHYPAYEKGDTLFYKSIVTEDIDTFLVSDFVIDTVFGGSALLQRSAAIFGELVADTLGDDFFYISNEPFGAVFAWDSASVYFQDLNYPLDTTIQEFNYSNLLIASTSRSDTTSSRLFRIYFDWNYGLVKYVQNNLDSYELFRRP